MRRTCSHKSSSKSNTLPDSGPIPDVPISGPSSSSADRHSPERNLSLEIPHFSAKPPTPAEPLPRERSRSPSVTLTFSSVLGLKLNELERIRLIPNRYPNKMFALRRYDFPSDGRIKLRTARSVLQAMPTAQQIVLSTSSGDAFAMLEKIKLTTVLRALYAPIGIAGKRARINMHSGAVEAMGHEEIAECPVGTQNPISKHFKVVRL